MTLLFNDGFDLLSTADLTLKWTANNNASGFNTSGGFTVQSPGRLGTGKRLQCSATHAADTGNTTAANITKILAAPISTIIFGMAMRCDSSAFFHPIWLKDSAGTLQFMVDLDATLHPRLWKGNAGTLLLTSSVAVVVNSYAYWEFSITVSTTVGSATMRIDSAVVGTFSGNTQQSANANVQTLILGDLNSFPIGSAETFQVDDLYVCDSAGTNFNTFLGDIRLIGQVPNAAGSSTAWQIAGTAPAATNFGSVNQNPQDGDTTYVAASQVGQIDTYRYPALPAATTQVLAVIAQPIARRDDAGVRSITTHVRSNGLEGDAPTSMALGSGYAMGLMIMTTNPTTGAAWTPADVNAAEFGPKLVV